jgi:hypothetical protein
MAFAADPGALLARSYILPRGPRARLRLARSRDLAAIEALMSREGRAEEGFDVARVLRGDPRRQLALTAAGLVGSAETVLGFGAIDLDQPGVAPKMLVVDHVLTDGLDQLLADALVGRAQALLRTRAA